MSFSPESIIESITCLLFFMFSRATCKTMHGQCCSVLCRKFLKAHPPLDLSWHAEIRLQDELSSGEPSTVHASNVCQNDQPGTHGSWAPRPFLFGLFTFSCDCTHVQHMCRAHQLWPLVEHDTWSEQAVPVPQLQWPLLKLAGLLLPHCSQQYCHQEGMCQPSCACCAAWSSLRASRKLFWYSVHSSGQAHSICLPVHLFMYMHLCTSVTRQVPQSHILIQPRGMEY